MYHRQDDGESGDFGKLIEFRKKRLRELLRELEDCAYGYHLPVFPFLSDESGVYSEEKAGWMAGRLAELLKEREDVGTEEVCAFYRSLWYCVLRIVTTPFFIYENYNEYSLCEDPGACTFRDLAELLQPEEVDMGGTLEKHPMDGMLIKMMISLYEILCEGEEQESGILWGETVVLEDSFSDFFVEDDSEDWESLDWPDEETQRELDKLGREIARQKEETLQEGERLQSFFVGRTEYCEAFENVLRLFAACHDPARFAQDLRFMMTRFLEEQEKTLFYDKDVYLSVMGHLRSVEKMIRRKR